MSEHWREFLYPLGFIAPLAFGSRVLFQWLISEARKESVVTGLFWKLSLAGNVSLWLHSILQQQIHVALIQSLNGVISWRNLNLMQPIEKQATLRKTVFLILAAMAVTFFLFFIQGDYFRIPQVPWQTHAANQVPVFWHILGSIGLVLFNSRFWLQWICAEKYKKSYLGSAFWWISLAGDTLCLAYFALIYDPVNFIGPVLGLIPYVRNLMLIRRAAIRKSS